MAFGLAQACERRPSRVSSRAVISVSIVMGDPGLPLQCLACPGLEGIPGQEDTHHITADTN